MTWIAAILLAALTFAIAVVILRVDRLLWSSLAAALAFGLAGYAVQARPDVPTAAKPPISRDVGSVDVVAARKEFIGSDERSYASSLVTIDALARRGRYAQAAEGYSLIVKEEPDSFEAWLALAITLTEHAEGFVTLPALYAYDRAEAIRPDHPGPGYFQGVSSLRQGRLQEARDAWAGALADADENAEGREKLVLLLDRLDQALALSSNQRARPTPGTMGGE